MYKLNVTGLIKYLGGATKVAEVHSELAEKYGYDRITRDSIYTWCRLGQIRSRSLPSIYHIADVLERPLHIEDFVIRS